MSDSIEQKDQLFEMINNGFKGLFQLNQKQSSFNVEDINRMVEDKLAEQNIVTTDDFDSQLSNYNVITTDNLEEEISNNVDIIGLLVNDFKNSRWNRRK